MGKLSRMTGTPWHVEPLHKKENDDRRHKSRCKYYNRLTKTCNTSLSDYYGIHCGGSAHCMFYKEDDLSMHKKLEKNHSRKKSNNSIKKEAISHDFSIGDRVHHKTYGTGRINNMQNDIATIKFVDGSIKKLSLTYCINKRLLTKS